MQNETTQTKAKSEPTATKAISRFVFTIILSPVFLAFFLFGIAYGIFRKEI